MKRFLIGAWLLTSATAIAAEPATAQLSANVQISWHWSDDGWRSSGPVVDGYVHWTDDRERRTRYEPAPVRARALPVSFHVPPGHMPPAGMCRLWIIGLPPGHQPPPQPCARVFRSHRGPDAVILHSPGRYDRYRGERDGRYRERWDDDWDDWDDDWDDDDRWEDGDRKRGPDRGRRGRGGRGGL